MFASIVTDLGFGDAGKGTTVDFLARQTIAPVIVRFNGGAQAAHNVHTDDGRHHTFSQFGSGMFVPGAVTYLSRFVLFDPIALHNEAKALEQNGVQHPLARLMVDDAACVVTPFHKAANRLRESLRGAGRHGSVGMGIGETMNDSLCFPEMTVYVADLRDGQTLLAKLTKLQELKRVEFASLLDATGETVALTEEAKLLIDPGAPKMVANVLIDIAKRVRLVTTSTLKRLAVERPLIFEGAQGVLIDEWHGFHPFTTWSTTTPHNAETLLKEIGYMGQVHRYGVIRAYSTRHGPGPFPTYDAALTALLPDSHNHFGQWQREFRVGWLDIPLTRYALSVSETIDSLVVTHLDRFQTLPTKRVATSYEVVRSHVNENALSALVVNEQSSNEQVLRVETLKPKLHLEDLRYQETLTGLLGHARPKLAITNLTGEQYASHVGALVGKPVSITSYGRTASSKRVWTLVGAH